MLEHGGRLLAATRQYGIPLEQWLDLSTGINPNGWQVPVVPVSCWQRLPEDEDGLLQCAAAFYSTFNLLPTAGSQAAIRQLPFLRARSNVAVLSPTYAEHGQAWQSAGHDVVTLEQPDVDQPDLNAVEVVVVVNPNNPTGRRLPVQTLLEWRERLADRGGWLVVDEAFMDATPEDSLARHAGLPGLVVLRSLGKFFGLAGARVGFVLAWPELLERLNEANGPWPVSGPARWVAQQALSDLAWHASARQQLPQAAQRLAELLSRHELAPGGETVLFQWVPTVKAEEIHCLLARQGIYTRLFKAPAALRFGLPGDAAEWGKLEAGLTALSA